MRRLTAIAALVLAAGCATEYVRRSPAPAAAAPKAADHGAELLGDDCLACHTGDLVRQQRLTDKQWTKTLDKMRGWGAPTEDGDVPALLTHLESIGAATAGPYRPLLLSVDEASALFAHKPDGAFAHGDAKKGAQLYADQCSPCHGEDAKGGSMGVALAGRHILDRAPDLAAVVRKGRGLMPGFDAATDTEIADQLAYLRSLSGSR
jgi:mono/diheme cytochrome c family protein